MFKKSVTVLSHILFLLGFLNNYFNWNLLNIPSIIFLIVSIFIGTILLWVSDSTIYGSLLSLLLLSFVKEFNLSKIFQFSFGNNIFGFLFFSFIVTYVFSKTNILKIFISKILNLKTVKNNPNIFIVTFLVLVFVVTAFISPTVSFMFFLPLQEEILYQLNFKKSDKLASYYVISMFITIAISTAATPINHIFALNAMSMYEGVFKVSINHLDYMSFALPTSIIIFLFLVIVIYFKFSKINLKSNIEINSLKDLKITTKEKIIAFIFISMILMWILPEILSLNLKINLALPPLLATILLLVIKDKGDSLMDINEVISKAIHWQSMFLLASTLAFSSVLASDNVGFIAFINDNLGSYLTNLDIRIIVLVIIFLTLLTTNLTSNLVTVSLFASFVLTILIKINGLNIALLVSLIGYCASLAFLTAGSMPYVSIAIGSKWCNNKDVLVFGIGFFILAIIVVSILAYPIGIWVYGGKYA